MEYRNKDGRVRVVRVGPVSCVGRCHKRGNGNRTAIVALVCRENITGREFRTTIGGVFPCCAYRGELLVSCDEINRKVGARYFDGD